MSILNFGFIKLSPGWTLIYLISVSMLTYIDLGSIAGLIPTLKDELGISDAEAGLLGTAYSAESYIWILCAVRARLLFDDNRDFHIFWLFSYGRDFS